jgi:hypothetical protein
MDCFDKKFVETAIHAVFERCREARMAGGISREEVVDHIKAVPENWWYDNYTCYYLPQGFQFSKSIGVTIQ